MNKSSAMLVTIILFIALSIPSVFANDFDVENESVFNFEIDNSEAVPIADREFWSELYKLAELSDWDDETIAIVAEHMFGFVESGFLTHLPWTDSHDENSVFYESEEEVCLHGVGTYEESTSSVSGPTSSCCKITTKVTKTKCNECKATLNTVTTITETNHTWGYVENIRCCTRCGYGFGE